MTAAKSSNDAHERRDKNMLTSRFEVAVGGFWQSVDAVSQISFSSVRPLFLFLGDETKYL